MSLMCAYQNCLCVKYPCSRTAFFRLPTDERRSIWIKNSGNKSLINISAKAHRFFCENHFRQCDIRTQFNRKTLRKHAVPVEHESSKMTIESSEVESKPARDAVRLNKNDDENEDGIEESNFVIEKLESDSNTIHFYEEEEEMPDFESQGNDNTNEEQVENSYTLLDFYLSTDNCDVSEQIADHTPIANTLQEVSSENYKETAVDSSTLEIDSQADISIALNELEVETEVPTKKRKPNEDKLIEFTANNNCQITTSNNDYQEDKHFALSLVGYFQRLPTAKKAVAKLKILQYLTELDIGLIGNL